MATTAVRKPRRISVTPRKAPSVANLETMVGEPITFDSGRSGVIWGLSDAPRTVWVVEDDSGPGTPLTAVHIDQRGVAHSRGTSQPNRTAIVAREALVLAVGRVIVGRHEIGTDRFPHSVLRAHLASCEDLSECVDTQNRHDVWRFVGDQNGLREGLGEYAVRPVSYCERCLPLAPALSDAAPGEPESDAVSVEASAPAEDDAPAPVLPGQWITLAQRHLISTVSGAHVETWCGHRSTQSIVRPDDATAPTCTACAQVCGDPVSPAPDVPAPVERPAVTGDEGWAWGEIIGEGEWLTVLGSHYRAPVLHSTPDAARAASVDAPGWCQAVVARVRMVYHGGVASGRAFRILELDQSTEPAPGTPGGNGIGQGDAPTMAAVPVPARGSGPVQCGDPRCRGHRARCVFGHQHTWSTWYENGRLMRTTDTYHCHKCGGVCIGDEPAHGGADPVDAPAPVGPEQGNLAPAVACAAGQGWIPDRWHAAAAAAEPEWLARAG